MRPEILSFPHVSSYPTLLLLGFFFAFLLARRRAPQFGIASRHVDNVVLILLITGPGGSRLFSRLFEMHLPLLKACMLWEGGGLVFYGGALLGAASVALYGLVQRLALLQLGDLFVPSLALGLAFGRIGCFLGGCCWGDVCVHPSSLAGLTDPQIRYQIHTIPCLSWAGFPLAVTFPHGSDPFAEHLRLGLIAPNAARSLPVHPTQLYEAFLAFVLCWVLTRSFRTRKTPGEISCAFGLGYACIRFSIEFLRADNQPAYRSLTLSQVVSILIAIASIAVFAYLRRRKRPDAVIPELTTVPL